MSEFLQQIPQTLILAALLIVAAFLLLIPLVLKLAGLTGQQIIDVLTMTTKFVIEIISEFRSENKSVQ